MSFTRQVLGSTATFLALFLAAPAVRAWTWEADMHRDPVGSAAALLDGDTAAFTFLRVPPSFPGDRAGAVRVRVDSSLPTARLEFPLPRPLTMADSFRVHA